MTMIPLLPSLTSSLPLSAPIFGLGTKRVSTRSWISEKTGQSPVVSKGGQRKIKGVVRWPAFACYVNERGAVEEVALDWLFPTEVAGNNYISKKRSGEVGKDRQNNEERCVRIFR